jgi:hypothetical protein
MEVWDSLGLAIPYGRASAYRQGALTFNELGRSICPPYGLSPSNSRFDWVIFERLE